ncbi:indole-3-glycerol phosphate synthase TrpC [Blattabacterium cuenoti]|uniref:indole-3-glycerol phosphate synthase TrpC n=1 Tax=Blattabacterium cuenoti TaxID=1653831 RepID=UPI00163CC362|nr:indole-3-glycerol phosphate synthase TrpC [Blattabacterium cuenoti]
MINDILEKIIFSKKKEIQKKKVNNPIDKLKYSSFFNRKTISLRKNIKKNKYGIIAEFKSKSPSNGIINNCSFLEDVVKGYELSKVSGISILTDFDFFSGHINNIKKIRNLINIPILRKDFIIDEYQIIESKSIGSDVILLIAYFLSKNDIQNLSNIAKSIGLEVILEIHKENEIEKITENIDFVGVNNRDLKSFKVIKNNCVELFSKIPNKYIKIAESGINSIEYVIKLKKIGFKGFLIGEYFMKSKNPAKKCKIFMDSLYRKEQK